jgi:peptide/nickel transport system substrate-binding protein
MAKTLKERRIDMKGIRMCVKMLTLVSMLIAGLALCLAPASSRAEVKEITIGIGIDADTLNPQEQTTTLPQNMCDLMYDSFFYQDPEGKLHPRLATKYEVSEDGLTYTIHLRKGIKFSDGTDFNADAVKLTWDRILNPKMRVPLRFAVSMVEECAKIDDHTVALRLKYGFAPLAPSLSMSLVSPISPAALKKYGEDVRQHPVGAGPYILKEWVKGDRIVMVRNENYWGKRPTVAKIIWKIVPEAATREAMLRAGQIEVCYKPAPSNVAALKADPNITVEMPLDTRTIFMGLNCQKGITTNKKVRQAFNYAVDKKAIVKKILFDTAEPMEGPVSPKVFGYARMAKQYDYNPEKAKQLLKEANFDFSKTVNMRTPHGRYLFDKQVSEAIQAYLQAIGVKAELRVYDWPTYIAGLLKPLDKTELEVFLLGWGPLILDADMGLSGQFTCAVNPPKGLGASFYCNPEYDKIMTASREEQDPEKRLALLKKASEIVWDDCPWMWLHVEKFVIAYSSKIKGMVVTPTEKFYLTDITMD